MKKKHLLGFRIFIVVVISLLVADCTKTAEEWVIASGTTKTVNETTQLSKLTIEDNAELVAPEGYILTLTVDGVETGQVLKTWEGVDYKFAPGTYQGDIVLTVSEANDVTVTRGGPPGGMPPQGGMPSGTGVEGGREGGMPEGGIPRGPGGPGGSVSPTVFPFRQALYLDADGIDLEKSVLAAVQGETPTGFDIQNIRIESKGSLYKDETSPGGTGFNGIYTAGGEYNIKKVEIDLFGDGRSDFQGYGSAVVAIGDGTKLVLDNVTINTQGVVRAGVIAKDGSRVIVKNSNIVTRNGVLPPGYVATMDTSQMRSTLWISGMTGNVRATSILGTNTQATYINSSISSEGWGVLSTDGTNNIHLNVINCKATITGEEGYGSYNDPSAHVAYYGTEFNMATFASVIGSGDVYYGDSTREAVAGLNEKFDLGLTDEELNAIPVKPTIINSRKYGVMWHRSGNPLTIDGGTIFNTAKTTFFVAGVPALINMDGSGGAQINSGTGVIMQVASDDQPMDMSSAGYYEEPTTAPEPIEGFDTISPNGAATANFSNIDLKGDFYNSIGWGKLADRLNMAINLDNAGITGVISASESHHSVPKITVDNHREFHSLTDTPCPVLNNGVIVNLTNGSNWTVTGTSYLTRLVLDSSSSVTAEEGSGVSMTVNGTKTDIVPGNNYTGTIVITVE